MKITTMKRLMKRLISYIRNFFFKEENVKTYLDLSGNKLKRLPELPNGLKKLWCHNNNLINLPELPNGLTDLYCYNNKLTNLPELPNGLTNLYCPNNLLINLPELPEGLKDLSFSDNQLTSLPTLPDGLIALYCSNNPLIIESLPTSLKTLWCNKSQLSPNFKKHEGLRIIYVLNKNYNNEKDNRNKY